jgi:hypothetical protein
MKSYLQHYNYGQLFKNSLAIYFRFFIPLVGIVAIFELPALLLIELTSLDLYYQYYFHIVSLFLFFIAYLFAYFAVVGEISEVCLGSKVSFIKALSRVSARGVGRLLGTQILLLIFLGVSFAAPALAGFFLNHVTGYNIGLVIGIIIGIVFVTALLIRYLFIGQVVILERKYLTRALKRSAALVHSRFWKIALYLLLFSITMAIPLYAATFGFRFGLGSVARFLLGVPPRYVLVLVSTLAAAVDVIATPLPYIFMTLFYYSLRIEKYDLTKEDLVEIKTFEAI